MERNDIAILILVAVLAVAFPFVHSTRATADMTTPIAYQMSALSASVKMVESVPEAPAQVSAPAPWNIIRHEEVILKKEVTPEVIPETIVSVPEVPLPPVVIEPIVVQQSPALNRDTAFEATVLREIQRLTDRERGQKNLASLAESASLAVIAIGHSSDMITTDYFSHTTPGGCTLTCRFEAAAYSASTWGENIASISGDNMPTAKEVAGAFFEQWMHSRGHRDNILSDEYTHQGVGVVKVDDTIFVTVNFSKPL